MKTKLSIFGWVRHVLLLVFSVLGFQLNAQSLTLTAEQSLLCGGGSVVLHASPDPFLESLSPYYSYQYREADAGPAWHDAGSSATKEKIFVGVMSNTAEFVEYRVVVKPRPGMPPMPPIESTPVKIVRDKSDACTKTCHQTATGEYFMGTDFTLNNPVTKVEKPVIPDEIETFFNENDIEFYHTSGAASQKYYITNDLSEYFDGQLPKLDTLAEQRGESNYYYVVEDNIPQFQGFEYRFPCSKHHGSPYSYIMRAYLIKTKAGCAPSAQVKLETGHGNQTEDRAVFKLYDEVTETMVKEGEIEVTYGAIKLDVPDECVGHLIRMDVEFHGNFPEDKYDPATGKYNGLEYYLLVPLLQQFDGCFKMAIDYISAEVASVCIGTGPYCVDGWVPVNAAGFSSKSVLRWESYDEETGTWVVENDRNGNPLVGSAKTIEVLVKQLGAVKYRVYDMTDERPVDEKAIGFVITGSECDPPVDSIVGDSNVCAPSRQLKYEVLPANASSNYRYDWTLYDSDNNKVNTDGIFSFESDITTGTLLVNMPAGMAPGKYSLSVQLMKKLDDDNFVEVNKHNFTIPIKVFAQPSAQFTIKGGDEKLCPYAANVQFNAVDKNIVEHVFAWQNATPTADDVTIADITVPVDHCEKEFFEAGLIVHVKDFEGCADTALNKFEFNHSQPVIDCKKLGGDSEIFLDSSAVDSLISLPLPEVSATCDADPTIEIEFEGFEPDMKTPLVIDPIIAKYSQLVANPELLDKRLPFTAGKPGSANADNGITVTYVAKDGCAKASDTCKFKITVYDTFPPRVDCSKIPNNFISDSLSSYPHHQCVAIPGTGNPMYLPILTAPSLEDTLHHGSFITGVFAGRSDDAADLNDPFPIGVTTIRWEFIDKAGNVTPCIQTVEVIDNSLPDPYCPDIHEFVVEPDNDGCVLSGDGLIAQIKQQLGTDLPVAHDYCQGDVELKPTYYYYDDSTDKWAPFDASTFFELNKHYTIQWRFYKQAGPSVDNSVYVFCEQGFQVLDNAKPKINCDTIPDPMIDYAIKGKCAIATKDFLKQYSPWPVAKLVCSGDTIHGVLTLRDGSPLPDSIAVGDTVPVLWTFYNPAKSSAKATCEKNIYIRSSNDPVFDCSSLGLVVDTAAKGSCEVPIDHLLDLIKPWPTAIDSCTGHEIPGKVTTVDGNPLPEKLAVGDTLTMLWTFVDPDYTSGKKTCTQLATVIGDNQPIFDCNSLDTIRFFAHGSCSYVPSEGEIDIPVAKDSCTGAAVPGIGSREDGLSLTSAYEVGVTTLHWRFISPYSIDTTKVCDQPVLVKSDKKIETFCENRDSFPVIQFELTNGECSVNPEDVLARLTDHYGKHPCLDLYIKGVPSRSDGAPLDSVYGVDTISIVWTFTDTTNTLVDPVSTCDQILMITNNNGPRVDCERSFPSVTLQMDTANCGVDASKIPVYLDEIPVNPCNGDVAVVDTSRSSGKPMNALYELGVETVTWKFTFMSNGKWAECKQKITIIDTVPPFFDCSTLKDITVMLEDSAINGYPYSKLVAEHGLYIPQAIDRCCDAVTSYKRSDGKQLEENYPCEGDVNRPTTTTITWIFTDCNGVSKSCPQNITVQDMVPPVVICPTVADGNLKCLLMVPDPFSNYEEFKAAGGSIQPEDRAVLSSFTVVDTYDPTSDSCNAKLERTYQVVAVNGKVVSCENPMHYEAHDDVAPEFVGIPANGITKVSSCSELDTIAPIVTVVDNCDPNPTLIMQRISNQDVDPSKCGHYNYDVVCTWWASDRCGNAPEPVNFIVHVVDTVAPIVHTPDWWGNALYPDRAGNCKFKVPNITDFPKDSIFQNCGVNDFLKIWQEPAAGTPAEESMWIYLYISDVCGNTTVLSRFLTVQNPNDIINITHPDFIYVCGDDSTRNSSVAANDLVHGSIREAHGEFMQMFDSVGHVYDPVPTTFVWDYYINSISPENLIYSNNPYTYGDLFDIKDENGDDDWKKRMEYTRLFRRGQSAVYWFVAYDTLTGCQASASVDIEVRERPRIDLASGKFPICESDSLPLHGEFGDMFPVCVDPMGGEISYQGWHLNDTAYVPQTPVELADGEHQKAYYVATNECGTKTSLNTLFLNCGPEPETLLDSLNLVGGSWEKLKLYMKDSLYTRDSVDVQLYTHYDPARVLLSTKPQNKPRVWEGDDAMLVVTMPYDAALVSWRRVEGEYDARGNAEFDRDGNVVIGGSFENDDVDLQYEEWLNRDTTSSPSDSTLNVETLYYNRYKVEAIADSSLYYVVVGNGVCPAVSSNVVNIDVMKQLPTLITPYSRDGMNDDFMRGHRVSIFNRYGGLIFSGNDGWDGTSRGLMVDPGVYYYEVEMANGAYKVKGSVEVAKF